MECTCLPNNGPSFTSQPHMIPGYMGYVPSYKFKFGNTYAEQTHRLFLDPCVNMSPRSILTDVCPADCSSGGFLQNTTGFKFGQCGCSDPFKCGRDPSFFPGRNRGQETQTPRFQTIMNQTYAPFCIRSSTRTFEQDTWRDKLFQREKESLDGWRFCYKSKPWDKPERLTPWEGDNSEFRRTQTTLLPQLMKNDLEIQLRGYEGISRAGGCCCPPDPYAVTSIKYNEDKPTTIPKQNCAPTPASCCGDIGVGGDCGDGDGNLLNGLVQEMGELPIISLHKQAQKREDKSGKFYPEERGLARVCNPVGSSYLTARPFRCNPIYKFCEPVIAAYSGHVPGERFVVGERRGKSTKNAMKYMTYRV